MQRILVLAAVAVCCCTLRAQVASPPAEPPEIQRQNTIGKRYLQHLVWDETDIWTSPAKVRPRNLQWLIPFVSISAGLFAEDSHLARQVPVSATLQSRSRRI